MTSPVDQRTRTRPNVPPVLWCRDSVSCLQATFATVLDAHGADPLDVLGSGWQFRAIPGDVSTEEFYFPVTGEDLGAAVAPHHPLSARWRSAPDLDTLLAQVDGGVWPVAAVDNYHLPFRPAYHDVHAAHLLVVWGRTPDGQVLVSDAMPPAYQGPLDAKAFLASWGSENPADHQDAFFSDSAIDRRWLDVRLTGPVPAMDPDFLSGTLRADLDDFDRGTATIGLAGRAGLHEWAAQLSERVHQSDPHVLTETYVFGWGQQAQADLHAELLLRCGVRWRMPFLGEAGRLVQRVAHTWTGVRITAAHGRAEPLAAASDLTRHLNRLLDAYDCAVAAVADALAAMRTGDGTAW